MHTISQNVPWSSCAFAAYSDRISGEEICTIISKVSGRPCEYRQLRTEDVSPSKQDVLSALLPQPLGSMLYDQDVWSPRQLNEILKCHKISISQTSFEEYLKAVLPKHLEELENRIHEPSISSIVDNAQPEPTTELDGILAECQRVLDGMEEGLGNETIGVHQALQPGRRPEETLRDTFMGSQAEDMVQECMELLQPDEQSRRNLLKHFGAASSHWNYE